MNIKGALHLLNRRDHKITINISPVFKFILIALIITALSLVTTKIIAQEAEGENILKQKQDAMSAGGNNESWQEESITSQASVLIKGSVGEIPDGVFKGEQTSFIPGGMVGATNQMIASLYIPQASGIEYIAQLKNNLLGKPVYAQGVGVGFYGLQPILPIWRGFRNVVYLIASVLFVIIGIMIMLRVKISPQAVITIQNSIPRVITTLVLVTFSYAIAGLVIDLSIFIQSFGIAILYSATGKTDLVNDSLLEESLIGGILKWLGISKGWVFSTFSDASLATAGDLMLRMAPSASLAMLGGVIGAIIMAPTGPGAIVGFGLGGLLVLLILCIFIMIWQVKFYFGLIKCYVSVLLKIILAPLEIGLGAFPNMKMGFSSWMLQLVANLSVFPISLLFLVLINLIIDKTSQFGLWAPNLINGGSIIEAVLNLATLPQGGLLPVAIGLSGLMLLSKLPDMIPQFIFMIKPSPWGTAVGEGMGNLPIVSGVYRNAKGAFDKNQGETILNQAEARFPQFFAKKTGTPASAAVPTVPTGPTGGAGGAGGGAPGP